MTFADEVGDLAVGLLGFGLTEYESRVYVALVSSGPSNVNELKFVSGVPRTKLYQVAQHLVKKGLVKELGGGKPVRFEAYPPEVFQNLLIEREKNVKSLKRVLASLKKLREKKILPQDVVEERYTSLGSQSLIINLKESIMKAQGTIKCIVDSWGLHLIQECSEELETVCRQDVDVRVVASVPASPPEFNFISSRLRLRYGKHLAGKSAFIIDSSELILVNSQTGRGYRFTLGELRSIVGEDLFNEYWKSSTSSRIIASDSLLDGLPYLTDPGLISRLFLEAVARSVYNGGSGSDNDEEDDDERLISAIGKQLLSLLEERVSPKLRQGPFDASLKLILALMQEELGEESLAQYDPVTKILRIELSDSQGRVPSSVWYFVLSGLLSKYGVKSELLHDGTFPEARTRIIQRKITF